MLPPFSGLNVMRRTEMFTSDLRKRIRIGAEIGQIIGDDKEVWEEGEVGRSVYEVMERNRVKLNLNK
jgi:hypothetical protein